MSAKSKQIYETSAGSMATANALDVPPGYRRTEVGVIPEDWIVTTLGEVVSRFVNGGTPPTQHEAYWKGDIPWITGADILNQQVSEIRRFITKDAVRSSSTNIIGKGNLLLVSRTGVGKLAIAPRDIAISQDFTGIYTKAERLSAEYLFRFLDLNQSVLTRQNQGTSILGITRETLSALTIFFPPSLAEQEAIAVALNDADTLVEALEQFLAKKRAIKQAAMQQLLTGKRRLPGFSGEWEVKPLKDVAPLQRGFDLPNSKLQQGPYPVVYSNGVLNHHVAFQVRGPGVVTGRSGTIGAVTFVEQDFWPHNTSLWVTSFRNNDPKFIFYLYVRIGLERFATGSGVPTLNRNDVHAFKVIIPPTIVEQIAIATVLSDMDAEIAALERRRDKVKQIKQGMMQQLLTGRIRLVRSQKTEVNA